MEFQQLVRRRRMVRNFDERPLPGGLLDRLIENAQQAPSAGFSQGSSFLLLEGAEQTGRYWDAMLPEPKRQAFPWPGLLRAPAIVIALADESAYRARYAEPNKQSRAAGAALDAIPYWIVDTAFAALLILLTATDDGLGALFFAVADIPVFRKEFGVPDRMLPIGAIAIGYPLPDRRSSSLARGRRPAAEIVHRGQW
jgi:nitroreductase